MKPHPPEMLTETGPVVEGLNLFGGGVPSYDDMSLNDSSRWKFRYDPINLDKIY